MLEKIASFSFACLKRKAWPFTCSRIQVQEIVVNSMAGAEKRQSVIIHKISSGTSYCHT